MPSLSAVDAIGPAFQRVQAMLFRPFHFMTWLKIGFIGWLAGGATFSANYNYGVPSTPGGQGSRSVEDVERMVRTFLGNHWMLIVLAVAFLVAFGLVFIYLSCRFRFIFFDSVLQKDAQIGRGWTLYRRQADRYLAFIFALLCISWALLAVVVGLPLWRAYKSGVFRENSFPEILRVVALTLLGIFLFALVTAIVSSLANDFGVPLLALDDLTIGAAGSVLKQMISADPWAFAGYLGMKFLLSIAAVIMAGIPILFIFIPLLLPVGILVVLVLTAVNGLGTMGIAIGIFLAAIGILALAALGIVINMLMTAPLAVFFTSYALYFFGGRYPKLGALLWPEPAPTPSAISSGLPAPPPEPA